MPVCQKCEEELIRQRLLPEPTADNLPNAAGPPVPASGESDPFGTPRAASEHPNPFQPRPQPQAELPRAIAEALHDSRFRPLSALPPEQRLSPRPKHAETAPGLVGAALRHDATMALAPVSLPAVINPAVPPQAPIAPLGLQLPSSQPQKPATLSSEQFSDNASPLTRKPRALPGQAPAKQADSQLDNKDRKIGFNCPACLAILVIKKPDHYDWNAAPCPNCQTVILPPRIVPTSPFSVVQCLPPGPTPASPKPTTLSVKPRSQEVMEAQVIPDRSAPSPAPSSAAAPGTDPTANKAPTPPKSGFPLLPRDIIRGMMNQL